MNIGDWIKRATPTILTTLGAAGTALTAFLVARGTPSAIERKERAQADKGPEKLTVMECIEAEAPAYMPAIGVGIGTIACILGANLLNRRQQASLASAYAMLNQMYIKYRGRVKSLFGEEGDLLIERAIEQEEKDEDNDRPPWDEVQTFYLEPYGKFFDRTMDQIFQAEYHINRNLMLMGSVTFNDFLDFLDLEHVRDGDSMGWNLYDGEAFYGYKWIDFQHCYKTMDDGLTVCEIVMPFEPHHEETEFSNEYAPRDIQTVL